MSRTLNSIYYLTFCILAIMPAMCQTSGSVPESIQNTCIQLPDIIELKIEYRLPNDIQTMPLGMWIGKDGTKTAEQTQKVTEDQKKIELLISRYKSVLKHIKPGVKIYSLPGILSKGPLSYDRSKRLYCLELGTFDAVRWAGYQGEFGATYIYFNDKGVVTSLEPVIYKH